MDGTEIIDTAAVAETATTAGSKPDPIAMVHHGEWVKGFGARSVYWLFDCPQCAATKPGWEGFRAYPGGILPRADSECEENNRTSVYVSWRDVRRPQTSCEHADQAKADIHPLVLGLWLNGTPPGQDGWGHGLYTTGVAGGDGINGAPLNHPALMDAISAANDILQGRDHRYLFRWYRRWDDEPVEDQQPSRVEYNLSRHSGGLIDAESGEAVSSGSVILSVVQAARMQGMSWISSPRFDLRLL